MSSLPVPSCLVDPPRGGASHVGGPFQGLWSLVPTWCGASANMAPHERLQRIQATDFCTVHRPSVVDRLVQQGRFQSACRGP